MASTWTIAQSGQWNVAANWTGGVPNASNATANFTTLGTFVSPWTINLAGATETVGTLNVSASVIEHYTFDNGTLAMQILSHVRGATAQINVSSANTSSFSALDSSLTLDLLSNTTIDNTTVGVFDVAAKITGAGELIATGSGTVRIDNSSNNWTGGLFIEGGTVLAIAANVLAGGALDVAAAGAILDLDGNSQSVANLTGSGTIQTLSGSATLTVNETTDTTFAGTFKDGTYGGVSNAVLSLTKTGAGTLTLTGQNDTLGAVAINQGAIKLGSTDALSFEGSVSIASGASLDLNGFDTQIVSVSGAGSIVNSGSGSHFLQLTGTSVFNGSIFGAINIQQDNSNTLTLSGSNSYTGYTTLLSGSTLKAGAINAFSAASSYYLDPNASIDLNGFNETISVLTGTGKITNNTSAASTGILTFQNSGVTIYTGKLVDGSSGGVVGLDVAGSGQLVLAGANTYSGGTTIEAGATLGAGGENALSAGSVIDVKASGTLDIAGYDETIGGLTDFGTVSNSVGGDVTLTVGASSFAGAITDGSGVVGLTVAAGAAFHLSGESNTYSGTTNIGAGSKLYADGYGALSADSAVDISATGQLSIGAYDETIGGLTGSGAVALTTSDYITLTVDEIAASIFSGQFSAGPSGTGVNLIKAGAGTLTLSGNNSQAGDMSIQAGTLAGGASGAFTATGGVVVYSGATFDLGGYNQTIGNLASGIGGGGTVTNSGAAAATLTVNGTQSFFFGTIKDGASAVGFSLGATAILGLGGVNTYTGITRIGAGAKLYAAAANAFSAQSAVTIGVTGILDIHGYNQTVGAISGTGSITNNGAGAATLTENNAAAGTFTGTLVDGSGTLAFAKAGAGQLKLSGTNTYSGGTIIESGVLEFASNAAAGSGVVAFAAGAGATLQLDSATALPNNIAGFAVGDTIDLAGIAFAAGDHFVWQSTTGGAQIWALETASNTVVTTLKLAGHYDAPEFTVAAQQSGTAIGLAYNPKPLTDDFDANQESDILFQNTNTGRAALWSMDGIKRLSSGAVGKSPGTDLKIIGTGDFDGDGKADILWQNTTTGQATIWLMDGADHVGGGAVGAAPGTAVKVMGAGDFDGDGKSDILWENTNTGQVSIWLMDGANRVGGGAVGASPGAGWSIAGVGDFNNDGRSDIVWQNTSTGQAQIWFMNGDTKLAGSGNAGAAQGAAWQVKGVGDFNGDGTSDLLWENTNTGQLSIWFMNGTTQIGGGSPGKVAAVWSVAGTGDFNGDGKSDILWQNPGNGQLSMWLMDGATKLPGANAVSPTPKSFWHAVS